MKYCILSLIILCCVGLYLTNPSDAYEKCNGNKASCSTLLKD